MSVHTANARRLILFRHAKSAWPDETEDHARPLAERGRKAALLMGEWLEANGLVPDLALVSSARRTQETWSIASGALTRVVIMGTEDAIYDAEPSALLDVIGQTVSSVRTLLLVGHNPGIEELAKLLMKSNGGDAGARLREKFPTAAIAVLDFDAAQWSDIAPGSGRLSTFVTPKSIS